jgi:hypothetical protein
VEWPPGGRRKALSNFLTHRQILCGTIRIPNTCHQGKPCYSSATYGTRSNGVDVRVKCLSHFWRESPGLFLDH